MVKRKLVFVCGCHMRLTETRNWTAWLSLTLEERRRAQLVASFRNKVAFDKMVKMNSCLYVCSRCAKGLKESVRLGRNRARVVSSLVGCGFGLVTFDPIRKNELISPYGGQIIYAGNP